MTVGGTNLTQHYKDHFYATVLLRLICGAFTHDIWYSKDSETNSIEEDFRPELSAENEACTCSHITNVLVPPARHEQTTGNIKMWAFETGENMADHTYTSSSSETCSPFDFPTHDPR